MPLRGSSRFGAPADCVSGASSIRRVVAPGFPRRRRLRVSATRPKALEDNIVGKSPQARPHRTGRARIAQPMVAASTSEPSSPTCTRRRTGDCAARPRPRVHDRNHSNSPAEASPGRCTRRTPRLGCEPDCHARPGRIYATREATAFARIHRTFAALTQIGRIGNPPARRGESSRRSSAPITMTSRLKRRVHTSAGVRVDRRPCRRAVSG